MNPLRIAAIACLFAGALGVGVSAAGTGWNVYRKGDDVRYFGPRSSLICKKDSCRRVDYGAEVDRWVRVYKHSLDIVPRYGFRFSSKAKSALDDARDRNAAGWRLAATLAVGVFLFVGLAAGLFFGRRSIRWALRGTLWISLGSWVVAALVFVFGAVSTLQLSGTLEGDYTSVGFPFYGMLIGCLLGATGGVLARMSGKRDAGALDEALLSETGPTRCASCEAELRPGARFCDLCGQPISEGAETT